MKYWVFDLDGTLTDSFGIYFATLEELLGQPFSREERKQLIGLHPLDIFKSRLPAEAVSRAMEVLQERSENQAGSVSVYKEIRAACSWLADNDRQLAVWTSRDLASATLVLQKNGIHHFFDYVVSGDCVSQRKPHPEGLVKIQKFFSCQPGDIVMIGDHDHDMEAAKVFGAKRIRASWHNYWDHDTCRYSDKQFYCSSELLGWIQTSELTLNTFRR